MKSTKLVLGLSALMGCGAAHDRPMPTCAGDAFGLDPRGAQTMAAIVEKKRGTMGVATKRMVATSHPLATEAGLAMLRAGGSAADAFVAAMLVEDVVLPGVTSTAGIAGAMVYEAASGAIEYVHGGFADPIEPAARWAPGVLAPGRLVLIGGAPAAYAALVARHGKRTFASDVEPAIALAANGFALDATYTSILRSRAALLASNAYALNTFFVDGAPLGAGATLKLPEVASTLRAYASDPTSFYRGSWPAAAVESVNAAGGKLTTRDYETYSVETLAPMHGNFQGKDVYAGGMGGARLIIALEALDALRGASHGGDPSQSADDLERVVRVMRADLAETWLADRAIPSQGATLDARLEDHSIQGLPWGAALFAGGIPLPASAASSWDAPRKASNRMQLDPLSNTLVLDHGKPVAALAIYGSGLYPGDVQVLDAILARGLSPEDAVLAPRVGFFVGDVATGAIDRTANVVDSRFSPPLLCTMRSRGIALQRSVPGYLPGIVDTGFPTLVTLAPGELRGMTPELAQGLAAGD